MLTRPLLVLLGIAGVAASVALVVHVRPGRTEGLSRSVSFHRAVRAHAAEIALSNWEDDAVAHRWATEVLRSDEEGTDAVLPAFGAPDDALADDRAHLLIAMVASRAKDPNGLPATIPLEEAEQIDLTEVDPDLAPLAEAVRVYVFAEAGRCDRLEDPELAASHELLDGARALLIDGAHGCCAVRQGDLEKARDRIRRSAEDAERLGVAVDRVPLLRAWASLSAGDSGAASAQLDAIEVEHLGESDLMRYRMLRSAVAQGDDTLLSILDPRWLSSIVTEGIIEAIGRDAELSATIDENATARAARRFVEMELRLIEAARDIDPLFEHGAR